MLILSSFGSIWYRLYLSLQILNQSGTRSSVTHQPTPLEKWMKITQQTTIQIMSKLMPHLLPEQVEEQELVPKQEELQEL